MKYHLLLVIFLIKQAELYSHVTKLEYQFAILTRQMENLYNQLLSLPSKKDDFLLGIRDKLKDFPKNQQEKLTDQSAIDLLYTLADSVGAAFNLQVRRFTADFSENPFLTFDNKKYNYWKHDKTGYYKIKDLSPEFIQSLDRTPSKSKLSEKDLAILEGLTKEYKIHLMPRKNDIPEILYIFLKEITHNLMLRNAIRDFKFNFMEPEKHNPDGKRPNVPTIVIYPSVGKQNAQFVLDEIYTLFKGYHGINKAPRWNQKVTDLIFWAQGNGDDKIRYASMFEPGDDLGIGRVCYKNDITGIQMDYHLLH